MQKRSISGYSLAEMLVVIAIVGVMSLVSVPVFISYFRSMKIKSSMRQLTADLRSARQLSIAENRPVMVSFPDGGLGANRYQVYRLLVSGSTLTFETVGALKSMDSTVFFPGGESCPFTDVITPAGGTSGWNDLFFMPNGTVQYIRGNTPIPITGVTPPSLSGAACAAGEMKIKTDANIPKPSYTLKFYPNGKIQVN